MAIINGIAMGVNVLTNYQGVPSPHTYTGIRVYSNPLTKTDIDYIHIRNTVLTLSEINAITDFQPQIWTGNTIFLATFENTLNGGNITGLVNPILQWVVQRRKSTETSFTTLATVPVSNTNYIDTTAEPNVSYIYQITAINDTEASEPLVNTLDSSYFNCVLTNLSGTEAYVFDLNLDFSGYDNEIATQRYDGYNKYSAYSFGKRDFKTGDVSAILASDYCIDLTQTIDYIKSFNTFINNGEHKILKDRKGNVLKVVTNGGVKQAPLEIGIAQQPYIISFHFEESGEVDG